MLESEIKAVFQKFGKDFADAAADHLAARLSTQSKYRDTASRGGNMVSDPSLPMGGGRLESSAAISNAVEQVAGEIKKGSRSMGAKVKDSISEAFDAALAFGRSPSKFMGDKILESIVQDTEQFAKMQTDAHKKMIGRITAYTREEGTNIDELRTTTDRLQEVNKVIHNVANNVEGSNAELMKVFQNITGDLENGLDDISEVFENFSKEEKGHMLYMAQHGNKAPSDDASDSAKRAWEARQKTLQKASMEIEKTADVMAEATGRILNNVESNISKHNDKMRLLFKGMMAAGAMGGKSMIEDSLRTYEYNLADTFYKASISVGMAHHDFQRGLLDYRDVLRADAVSAGDSDIYSDASIDRVKSLQDLGKSFGVTEDEAFHLGMRMRDTAKLMGLNQPDMGGMKDFYRDAANSLNMSVVEFGDYFNDLAKDPAFANFANRLRLVGDGAQDAMLTEMKNRIRMNKILGLGNEELQRRLNLENAKKWAPLADKYRAAAGLKAMQDLIVNELGSEFALSTDQMQLLDDYKKAPELLTPELQKEAQALQVHFTAAMAKVQENAQLAYQAAPTDAARETVFSKYGVVLEQFKQFGDMEGGDFYNPEKIDQFRAHTEALGLDVMSVRDAVLSGDEEGNEKLQAIIDIISGDAETLKPDPGGFLQAAMEVKETFLASIKNPLIQSLGGLIGSIGGYALEAAQWHFLMKGLGIKIGKGGIIGKALGFFAGSVSGLAKGLLSIPKGLFKMGTGIIGVAGKIAKPALAKIGSHIAAKGGAAAMAKGGLAATGAAAKAGGKAAGAVGKSLAKKLPFVGALVGAGLAVDRLTEGDILGAGGEMLSGILSIVPGLGTVASIAVDGALIARDVAKANEESQVKLEEINNIGEERIANMYKEQNATLAMEDVNKKLVMENATTSLRKATEQLNAAIEVQEEDTGNINKMMLETLQKSNELIGEQVALKKGEIKDNSIKYNESKTTSQRLAKIQEQANASSKNWQDMVMGEVANAAAQYT